MGEVDELLTGLATCGDGAGSEETKESEFSDRILAGPLLPHLGDLRHGHHFCSFYGNSAEQLGLVIPFFKEALGRGEACLYVADDRTVEEIAIALHAAGVGMRSERGALVFVTKWQWRNKGDFAVEAMERGIKEIIERSLAPGFPGLWVAVDMTWTLEPDITPEALAEWESIWNVLLRRLPVVLLCQYSLRRLPPETLHVQIRPHPMVILGDQVYANFFYEPPEIFREKTDHPRRLQWILDQLRLASGREQALRESEVRFRMLVERVEDYAIFMLDPDGRIISWNQGAERIKGYQAEEIIGRHVSCFYTPEDVERGQLDHLLKTAEREGRVETEGWRVRKDGSRFWADVIIAALRDDKGKHRGFAKITRDLTARKRAEESVRQLSTRVVQLQDKEQQRIARELRAGVAQTINALTAELSVVKNSGIVFDWKASEALQKSLNLAKEAAKEVRSLSYLLHPRLLDDAGLIEAIRWYVGGFTERTGVKVLMDFSPKFGRLARDAERTLFRVVQESLTNIGRHSGSRAAQIRLTEDSYALRLEVRDNGRGIPPEILERSSDPAFPGVGIRGMSERMAQLGGRLEIDSGDWGTNLTASLPLSIARPERDPALGVVRLPETAGPNEAPRE